MSAKVEMQRIEQLTHVVRYYRENPVKCNACIVVEKIEIECFSDFVEKRIFLKNRLLEFDKVWSLIMSAGNGGLML